MWNPFSESKLPEAWQRLKAVSDLKSIDETSYQIPVAILKHSTRCSRSAFAKERLANSYHLPTSKFAFYYLDLLQYREVSNAITRQYGIPHQSPQLIIIRNGKAVFDTSHEDISMKPLIERIV
ncbi:MAG: bacillithiol system redox-active protein YtxJ [Salibacteraceae bacterium]